jgi:hypothetical protein
MIVERLPETINPLKFHKISRRVLTQTRRKTSLIVAFRLISGNVGRAISQQNPLRKPANQQIIQRIICLENIARRFARAGNAGVPLVITMKMPVRRVLLLP